MKLIVVMHLLQGKDGFISANTGNSPEANATRICKGDSERAGRALAMVKQMETEGFGGCTNVGNCSSACPKGISLENIALMNRDFMKASLVARPARTESDGS